LLDSGPEFLQFLIVQLGRVDLALSHPLAMSSVTSAVFFGHHHLENRRAFPLGLSLSTAPLQANHERGTG
jgi:hypothetical protein